MTQTSDESVCRLTLPLYGGGEVSIQDQTGGRIEPLAALLDLPFEKTGTAKAPAVFLRKPTEFPRGGVVVYQAKSGNFALHWLPQEKRFDLYPADALFEDPVSKVRLWHYATVCAGIAAQLQGLPCLLIHGAMLICQKGAIVLLGESRIGKSTTSNRWKCCGHSAPADDMLLLEFTSEGFFAHALPTWSRQMQVPEHLEKAELSAGQAVPVVRVLGLGRGKERESVEEISRVDYFGQIARSSFFHCRGIVKLLPEDERQRFSAHIASMGEHLAERFPSRALFAHLDGDLEATLADNG